MGDGLWEAILAITKRFKCKEHGYTAEVVVVKGETND